MNLGKNTIYYSTISSPNQYDIKLKIFKPQEIHGIVIACHGFCSSKENKVITAIGEKLLEDNILMIAFDFPEHGESDANEMHLTLNNCINDIETIKKYAMLEFKNNKIGILGISYGAYVSLLEINKNNFEFSSITLVTPAICMGEIFMDFFADLKSEDFESQGYVDIKASKNIRVQYDFYRELLRNNIKETYRSNQEMLIIQASNDIISRIEENIAFIKINTKAEIEIIPDCTHKIEEKNIEKVVNLAIRHIKKYI